MACACVFYVAIVRIELPFLDITNVQCLFDRTRYLTSLSTQLFVEIDSELLADGISVMCYLIGVGKFNGNGHSH